MIPVNYQKFVVMFVVIMILGAAIFLGIGGVHMYAGTGLIVYNFYLIVRRKQPVKWKYLGWLSLWSVSAYILSFISLMFIFEITAKEITAIEWIKHDMQADGFTIGKTTFILFSMILLVFGVKTAQALNKFLYKL